MNLFELAALVGFVRILVGISIIAGTGWFFCGRRKPISDGLEMTTAKQVCQGD